MREVELWSRLRATLGGEYAGSWASTVVLQELESRTVDEAFIIGGRKVYRQFLPVADRLCLTRVHHVFPEADVFFPDVDWRVWREAERTDHAPDERNPYALTFATYLRR